MANDDFCLAWLEVVRWSSLLEGSPGERPTCLQGSRASAATRLPVTAGTGGHAVLARGRRGSQRVWLGARSGRSCSGHFGPGEEGRLKESSTSSRRDPARAAVKLGVG